MVDVPAVIVEFPAAPPGPIGPKGDPGGSFTDPGSFQNIATLTIPAGIKAFTTTEYRTGSGVGGGRYLKWAAPRAALPAVATVSGVTENAWWAQSLDGAKWYPDPERAHFDQFGCYRNAVVTVAGEVTSGTDDYPAWLGLLSFLNWSAVSTPMFSIYRSLSQVNVASGQYYFSKTLQCKIGTFHLKAQPTGDGLNGASFFFAANTTGVMVHHYNTSALDSGTASLSAYGSVFENILLNGTSGVAAAADGWRIWARVDLINCEATNFNRNGCFLYADVGGVNGTNLGNANGSTFKGGNYQLNGSVAFGGSGIVARGGDSNAIGIANVAASGNFDWGIWGDSFLNITLTADQTATNGSTLGGGARYSPRPNYSMCSYGGNNYAVVPGAETACETTVPGTDGTKWFLIGAGTPDLIHPLWTTGQAGKWRSGGSYRTNRDGNCLAVLVGCYSEGDEGPAYFGQRTLHVNCFLPNGANGGAGTQVTGDGLTFIGGVNNNLRFSSLPTNAADDTAAAAAGIVIGGTYRTGSALKVRVA